MTAATELAADSAPVLANGKGKHEPSPAAVINIDASSVAPAPATPPPVEDALLSGQHGEMAVDAEDDDEGEEDGRADAAGGGEAAAKKKKKKKNKSQRKKAAVEAAGGDVKAAGPAAANAGAAMAAAPASTTASGKQQTDPPTVPVSKLFPSGIYPEGQFQSYKDDNLWRETSVEKRQLERLQHDMINEVRHKPLAYHARFRCFYHQLAVTSADR